MERPRPIKRKEKLPHLACASTGDYRQPPAASTQMASHARTRHADATQPQGMFVMAEMQILTSSLPQAITQTEPPSRRSTGSRPDEGRARKNPQGPEAANASGVEAKTETENLNEPEDSQTGRRQPPQTKAPKREEKQTEKGTEAKLSTVECRAGRAFGASR